MLIEFAAKIVHHPLANAGGEIFFCIGANRSNNGNTSHCGYSEVEHRKFVLPGEMSHHSGEPRRQGF